MLTLADLSDFPVRAGWWLRVTMATGEKAKQLGSSIVRLSHFLASAKMSKRQLWLDAFYSASLNFKSECGVLFLALEDLAGDGSGRLAALLVGFETSYLRILNGADVQCEIALPQMAVAMCTFSMDGSLPGIAVAAGSSLYVYKNFKPYYKYTVPGLGGLDEEEITQLAAVPRSSPDMNPSSLIAVGTESGSIVFIDSQTFNAISKVEMHGAPSVIRCRGYFDVDASIIVGTGDGRVYHLRSSQQPMRPLLIVTASCPIVDMTFVGNFMAAATADKAIKFYTTEGQEIRNIKLEKLIVAMTCVEVKSQDASILAVSLADGTVIFYRQGIALEQFQSSSPIVSMISGRFGREDGVLVTISRDGDVAVKVLNRGFKLATDPAELDSSPSVASAALSSTAKKEILPTKTKLFVEQALREQEDPRQMYKKFQEGMCRAHLRALQEWSKMSSIKAIEPSDFEGDQRRVHLLAKLTGGGTSRMILQLLVQNVKDAALESLSVALYVTAGKLVLERCHVKLPLMIPYEQHQVRVNFRDPSNKGGQITIFIMSGESKGIANTIVCSAKIDISPAI